MLGSWKTVITLKVGYKKFILKQFILKIIEALRKYAYITKNIQNINSDMQPSNISYGTWMNQLSLNS